jgi:hypothetical protein
LDHALSASQSNAAHEMRVKACERQRRRPTQQQEMTMSKNETIAIEVVTDELLEFVSGGVTVDATGNIDFCVHPLQTVAPPHNPDAPIWK